MWRALWMAAAGVRCGVQCRGASRLEAAGAQQAWRHVNAQGRQAGWRHPPEVAHVVQQLQDLLRHLGGVALLALCSTQAGRQRGRQGGGKEVA